MMPSGLTECVDAKNLYLDALRLFNDCKTDASMTYFYKCTIIKVLNVGNGNCVKLRS